LNIAHRSTKFATDILDSLGHINITEARDCNG